MNNGPASSRALAGRGGFGYTGVVRDLGQAMLEIFTHPAVVVIGVFVILIFALNLIEFGRLD